MKKNSKSVFANDKYEWNTKPLAEGDAHFARLPDDFVLLEVYYFQGSSIAFADLRPLQIRRQKDRGRYIGGYNVIFIMQPRFITLPHMARFNCNLLINHAVNYTYAVACTLY